MKRLLIIILSMIGMPRFVGYILLGIMVGLFNFLFINCVTRVLGFIIAGTYTSVSQLYLAVFACIILLFIWARKKLSLIIIRLSQHLFWNLRQHILSLILKANYQQLSDRKA